MRDVLLAIVFREVNDGVRSIQRVLESEFKEHDFCERFERWRIDRADLRAHLACETLPANPYSVESPTRGLVGRPINRVGISSSRKIVASPSRAGHSQEMKLRRRCRPTSGRVCKPHITPSSSSHRQEQESESSRYVSAKSSDRSHENEEHR
jgi:hypothetical protein